MYDMYRGQSAGRTLDMRATTYITTGKLTRTDLSVAISRNVRRARTGDGGSDEGTGGAPIFFPPKASAFRSNAAG